MPSSFSILSNFSYADLPKTDAFFLTVAFLAIIVPPLLIFFSAKIHRKIREIIYFVEIEAVIFLPSIQGDKFLLESKKQKDETETFSSSPGNFLSLVSGLNLVLRIIIEEKLKRKLPDYLSYKEIIKILSREKIVTKSGIKKLKFIEWLNWTIVSGEMNTVFSKTVKLGVRVVWDMHREFNQWLLERK